MVLKGHAFGRPIKLEEFVSMRFRLPEISIHEIHGQGSFHRVCCSADGKGRPGTGPLTERPDRHPCRGNIRAGLALAAFTVAIFWIAGGLS